MAHSMANRLLKGNEGSERRGSRRGQATGSKSFFFFVFFPENWVTFIVM